MTTGSAHTPAPLRPETDPDWLRPTLQAVCRINNVEHPDLARGCLLSAHAESGATARAFTASTLDEWGRTRILDDLTLAVAELFSNALRHGRGSWPGTDYSQSIRLGLACSLHAVMCLVADPGSGTPALQKPDPLHGGGRGLQIVDALATTWGHVRAQAHGPGKTVWALFADAG